MKCVSQVFPLIVCSVFLCSCIKTKPPLRTWELSHIPSGSSITDFSLRSPVRGAHESYWDYRLGIVIAKDSTFNSSGEVVVFTTSGQKHASIKFDPASVTRSSWLGEPDRISYLLSGDLDIEDANDYRIEVRFDKPVAEDCTVVLHFLSHTDTKLIQ